MTVPAGRRNKRSHRGPDGDRSRDLGTTRRGGRAVGVHVAEGHGGWVLHWLTRSRKAGIALYSCVDYKLTLISVAPLTETADVCTDSPRANDCDARV